MRSQYTTNAQTIIHLN